MRQRLSLALAFGLGLAFADPASAQIKLGVAGPLTGGSAAFGAQLKNGTEQAVQIVSDVRSDNLFIQYNIYHMQVMEGDIARTLQKHLARIAHVQLADNPGRNEPGTGEINYPFLFRHLDRIGYRGWVGCEYKPRTSTIEGLGWHSMQTMDT